MNQTVTADRTTSTGTTPRWLPDAVIAVVVAALQVAGTYGAAYHSGISASPLEYAAGALAGLVLVVRRRFPVSVLVVTAALSVGCWARKRGPNVGAKDALSSMPVESRYERVLALRLQDSTHPLEGHALQLGTGCRRELLLKPAW